MEPLYRLPMEEYYYASASHIDSLGLLHKFHGPRLDMEDDSSYINSGVLFMNLSLLRKHLHLTAGTTANFYGQLHLHSEYFCAQAQLCPFVAAEGDFVPSKQHSLEW